MVGVVPWRLLALDTAVPLLVAQLKLVSVAGVSAAVAVALSTSAVAVTPAPPRPRSSELPQQQEPGDLPIMRSERGVRGGNGQPLGGTPVSPAALRRAVHSRIRAG